MSKRALLSYAGNAPAGNRWRCPVRRAGLPLAVFAIILQLALLFGHHHFDAFSQRGLATQTGQAADGSRQGQAPVAPAHMPCLLCLSIHAATFLAAGAPTLALPVAFAGVRIVRPPAASVPPPRAAAFDSRGPPYV